MEKNEIIKRLMENDSTVLSFPDRGPWGDSKYRGNCSGWYQAFLIWKYKVKKFAELFAGSGTGYDVAKDMEINYIGADLNPLAVRPGIICVNAVTDPVPVEFANADFVFMHPPYGAEIKIPYAGSMYPDPTGILSKSDLGQMPWDKFMVSLNQIVMRYFSAMEGGARMGILMGDVRRKGLHSMLTDIVKPGELEQVIIKMQHNTCSGGRSYSSKNFVHEYILVLKKTFPYILDFQVPLKKKLDVRDSNSATWRDVVFAVLKKLGKNASLASIYSEIEGHAKAEKNPHWRDKVRQVLQMYPDFVSESRGIWSLAA
mgnify:FL=1